MPIIDTLRTDINHAINLFEQANQNLSVERKQNITYIRNILKNTDPIEVRNTLLDYLNGLSVGIISILPFLEVNQFKKALKSVLELPRYQEKEFLRTVSAEIQSGSSIFRRMEMLGGLLQNQQSQLSALQQKFEAGQNELGALQKKVNTLNQEVERLRTENKFLNDRISQLSDENEHLKDLNAGITQKYDDLKQEYEALLKENRSLRQQLQSSVHSNYTKQEPKKENLTPTNCSIPKNYNFINSMPKQSAEPRSAAPNKPSVQQNERKLFNDTTSSNQRVLRKS